jgi:polyhydroxybutyrate depolymerase
VKQYSIISGGISRAYSLFSPPELPKPNGLVVFLHGKGGTAGWADSETGWSHLAVREGFALALPEALAPNLQQPPKFLTNPPFWNDDHDFRRDENARLKKESNGGSFTESGVNSFSTPLLSSSQSLQDDVAFLTAVIDDALNRTGTDPAKVFMAGFSNGAGMTFRFAAERADRVAAIATIAGYCWVANPKPVRPVPTLFVVGTVDPLIPIRGGEVRSPWLHRLVRRPSVNETLERWARAISCTSIPILQSETSGVRTDIFPGPVTFQCVTIEGLGHHWPGGRGQLNQKIAGPPSDAFDGTVQVWEFFKQNALTPPNQG